MIDFYINKSLSKEQIKLMMKEIFDIDFESIMICSLDELNEVLVSENIKCLCVVSQVYGDVSYFLQIYRIPEISLSQLIESFQILSKKYEINFFVPYNEFNDYYEVSSTKNIREIKINEDDVLEDTYHIITH